MPCYWIRFNLSCTAGAVSAAHRQSDRSLCLVSWCRAASTENTSNPWPIGKAYNHTLDVIDIPSTTYRKIKNLIIWKTKFKCISCNVILSRNLFGYSLTVYRHHKLDYTFIGCFCFFVKSLIVLRSGFLFSSHNLLISGTKIVLSLGLWQYSAI